MEDRTMEQTILLQGLMEVLLRIILSMSLLMETLKLFFLRNAKEFLNKCKTAKNIKIDIPLYQAGRPVFKFHVDKALEWPD